VTLAGRAVSKLFVRSSSPQDRAVPFGVLAVWTTPIWSSPSQPIWSVVRERTRRLIFAGSGGDCRWLRGGRHRWSAPWRALIAVAGRLRYVVPTLGVPLACGSEETWPGRLCGLARSLYPRPRRSSSPAPARIRGGPLSRPRRRARAATWLCPSDRRISTLHPPLRSVQRTLTLFAQAERRNAQLLTCTS